MRRLLLSLIPVNLIHELGTGRALDNAGREHIEVAQTMAAIDALVGRLSSIVAETTILEEPVEERAAA